MKYLLLILMMLTYSDAYGKGKIELVLSVTATSDVTGKETLNAALVNKGLINYQNKDLKILWKSKLTDDNTLHVQGEVLRLENGIERILGNVDERLTVGKKNNFTQTNEFGDRLEIHVTVRKQ